MPYTKLLLIACSLLIFISGVDSQELNLIPNPKEVKKLIGTNYRLSPSSIIHYSHNTLNEALYLQNILNRSTGFNIAITKTIDQTTPGGIHLSLQSEEKSPKEAYTFNSGANSVTITASHPHGIFNGIQTLLQLMPVQVYANKSQKNVKWEIPAVIINDAPTFSWRGMHLDVARHFYSVDFVKRFIDILAYHKMNTFHWHLTEDQGWRIEIKKYPRLTEVGAWRDSTLIGHMRDKPHTFKVERTGGYYTQAEIKEVVQYAQERHITIVPEIEMPGHAQAAVAAYPEFGCTGMSPGVRPIWGISKDIFSPEEKTIEFLKDVLDEVMALFPGEYIHIGGDEAHKNQWEESERIQELMRERGLHDMHQMQSWFITQIDEYLRSKGRKLIGWDEILEGGLADGAAVMSWRGEKGAIKAARMGHKAVMAASKMTYFNRYQSRDRENEPLAHGHFLPLETVYHFNPVPDSLSSQEATYILGAQGQLWSEYIATADYMEYMALPRLCALSDVVWSNNSDRDYQVFLRALVTHLQRLDEMQINYRLPDELR
ncbi:beta-N-acetylhexosaminidase [Carboxylicivirga marina]|uniref:beta-N-acetylhexosaminidase n=1 Tax=Carboxylicivirga marina TaxID=2800988 RepID=UPI002594F0EE|nr:beta-N-acetylhexosaminidase [uncultured Carboxylicivirga sp.]